MILQDLNYEKLNELVLSLGEQSFRTGQIFRNLHNGKSISEMTDVSKKLKSALLENYSDCAIEIIKELTSRDGTGKFLFKLTDGNVIEGVLMNYKYGNTLCVSTQVGCRMGCAFCASTINGLVRNLTSGEILSEVLVVNKTLGGDVLKRRITNVVLMGSGEPLDNYDNVINFLRLLSCKEGINISPRNVSLSTCGIVPKMYELSTEGLPVNLTISLHSPFDEERRKIMPVANAYTIGEIIQAADNYFKKTGRRYYFEYSLISGVNDTDKCVRELQRLLSGKPCHVNLIRLNTVKEKKLIATNDKNAEEFLNKLKKAGLSATLRRRTGADIDGACGQLRRRFIEGEKTD